MKLFCQFFISLFVSFTLLGEQALFNGKDLEGWDGNPLHWSVEDGAIVGVNTKENPTKGNTFLIWKGGNLKDFDLTLECKI
ncbi:MAG: family 16 glycoside hydrolase, partial [Opitutales bacterium]